MLNISAAKGAYDLAHLNLFMGSSAEGLSIAQKVADDIADVARVSLWDSGVFRPTHSFLESLADATDRFDAAILIATADDYRESRGHRKQTPRDNIIFELGLFIGAIGRGRVLLICEESASSGLPSDFDGITVLLFSRDSEGSAIGLESVGAQARGFLEELDPMFSLPAPRVSLICSTTEEIERSPELTGALKSFYRHVIEEFDRTPLGINTCGAEPLRGVFFEYYVGRLYESTRDQMSHIEAKVCWFSRPDATVGLSSIPSMYLSRSSSNETRRRYDEASHSDFIVGLNGRTGTLSHLEYLWREQLGGAPVVAGKPIVPIAWFGGGSAVFAKTHRADLEALDPYFDVAWYEPQADWYQDGRPAELAQIFVRGLQRMYFARRPDSGDRPSMP